MQQYYFVMIFLFLLSLSPNTHGDSLGYHFTVANSIYKYGKFPLDITHIHTILSGSGELLIAIGLLFGSITIWGISTIFWFNKSFLEYLKK